jgi:hypothetical protein
MERISPMPAIDPKRLQFERQPSSRSPSPPRLKPPAPKSGDRFLRGPIPLHWLSRAAALPGRSLHVALAVWFMAGLKKTSIVPISNVTSLQFGLDRNAKYRGLEWLEKASLIAVERRAGCAPIVTILDVPSAK